MADDGGITMFQGMHDSRIHNMQLRQALATLEAATEQARDDAALAAAVRSMVPFGEPVQFDPRFANRIAMLCSLPIVAAMLFLANGKTSDYAIGPAVVLAIIAASWLSYRMQQDNRFSGLSDKIYHKSTLFDYGLRSEVVSPSREAERLGQKFSTFKCGNHKREIRSVQTGQYEQDEIAYSYRLFHFHYVDRRTETYTTTDSNGNIRTRTRVVYDHYDRYGFLLPFGYARGLRITKNALGFGFGGWKSASDKFNRKFTVHAETEIEAARFLRPKVLLAIDAAGAMLADMTLEINASGELCLSFNDSNMIGNNRRYGIETPEAFAQEIAGISHQPKLTAALEFLRTLIKYNDNNFADAPNVRNQI